MPEIVVLSIAYAAATTAAFLFLARDHRAQRAEWTAERSRLLDRIMSRDLGEYKAYPDHVNVTKLRPILDDLDEARIEAGEDLTADLDERDRAFVAELRSGR